MAMETPTSRFEGVKSVFLEDARVLMAESFIVFLLGWVLVSHVFELADTISSPYLVGVHLYGLFVSGDWFGHAWATTRRTVYAFAVTLVIGTVIGVMMGVSRFLRVAWQNYIALGLALPSLFGGVFAAIWFGYSDLTPVVAGVAITFPYIAINVLEGVKDIDHNLYEMSAAFGVRRREVVFHVIIPAISTSLFAGARYAFAYSWKIVNLAELIVAEEGIGFMIRTNLNLINLTGVLAWVVIFVTLFLLVEYLVIQPIERYVFKWRRSVTMRIM